MATAAQLRRLLAEVRAHNRSGGGISSSSSPSNTPTSSSSVSSRSAATTLLPLRRQQHQGARLELQDGATYEGDVVVTTTAVDNQQQSVQPHGKGVYLAADGARYEGGYRLGVREGEGEWRAAPAVAAAAAAVATAAAAAENTTPISVRYRGPWVADAPHGSEGEAWYSDGARYVGDWERGKRQGWGKLERPWLAESASSSSVSAAPTATAVVVYEGEWREDAPHGRGRWTFEDGRGFFEGEFAAGVRVRGRLVSLFAAARRPSPPSSSATTWEPPASSVDFDYTGPLHPEDGSRHGPDGACACPGRWEYRGPWRAGVRHGAAGVCCWAGGARYEGDWQDDAPQGRGAWRAAASGGDTYVGEFERGLRHGRGVWRAGGGGGDETYAGGWLEGERQGQGECRYADGGRYSGAWLRGKRHGRGRMRFADGTVFDGAWEDDCWVQGAADPRFCRLRGLRRVVEAARGAGPAPAAMAGGNDDEKEEGAVAASASPGWFLIAARDELGNARLSGGDRFCVVVVAAEAAAEEEEGVAEEEEPSLALEAVVIDQQNGTYLARLPDEVLRRAGDYVVHVTDAATGEVVAGAPLPLTVVAGPVAGPGGCRAELMRRRSAGGGGGVFRPGEDVEVRVEARDGLGNLARVGAGAEGPVGAPPPPLPFSVEASLVWRGPLRSVSASASRSSGNACQPPPAPIPLLVRAEEHGWRARLEGEAAAALPRGEWLLEVKASGGQQGGRHLPGGPFLVVLAGEEEVEEVEGCVSVVVDQAHVWAARAAAAAGEEEGGGDDGEGSAGSAPRGGPNDAERAYIAQNPLVPVVENLRDLHLVSRVHEARRRQAAEAAAVSGRRSPS
jgi:hypothetical protein